MEEILAVCGLFIMFQESRSSMKIETLASIIDLFDLD